MRAWMFAAVCIVSIALGGTASAAPGPPAISAASAMVIDGWTGDALYFKNADAMRAPASTVKVMTALVVLRHHVPLKRVVTVSWLAASYHGSTAGLYAGEQMTVWNLLHGMLLPSGNDAAIALAEEVGGSVDRFVTLMNQEARRLHLTHTRYLTPNGFDTVGQVTTARDLARLARAAMQWEVFDRVVRVRSWTAWSADHRIAHHWLNLNKLLWDSRAVNGVKTGTTAAAGACLVSSARMDGKWIIAVNMGSSVGARFPDGLALLQYGLAVDGDPPTAH